MIILGIAIGFILGISAGVVLTRKKPAAIPAGNPVKKIVNERKRKIQQDEQAQRLQTLLSNIDNYDGTGKGQVKIG